VFRKPLGPLTPVLFDDYRVSGQADFLRL